MTLQIPTGETRFSLTYRTEDVIPVEIVKTSSRASFYNIGINREGLGVVKDLLDDRRSEV